MKIITIILLLLLPLIAYSEPTIIGNWGVDVSKDKSFVYAATLNDSGSLFGQYCFVGSGNCVYMIGIDTECKEGNKYPTLANSDAGAAVYDLLCDNKINDKQYRYYFTDFDEIDKVTKVSSKVGFAIPLNGDQFKVIRFDLTGSSKAIGFMRTIAEKMVPTNAEQIPKTNNEYL